MKFYFLKEAKKQKKKTKTNEKTEIKCNSFKNLKAERLRLVSCESSLGSIREL